VSERETLRSGGRQVEVHSGQHGDEQRQGRWAGQESNREQCTAEELDVIMNRRPQFRRSWEEAKVRCDDVVNESLEFGCA